METLETNRVLESRIEYKKQELIALLAEYNSLRAEIISLSEASRGVLNLTITLFGAFLGGLPLVIDRVVTNQDVTRYIFLIVPLFFFALAWTQLKYLMSMLDIGHYLQEHSIRQIRKCLEILYVFSIGDPGNKMKNLLSWEQRTMSRVKRFRVWWLPIIGSHYGIPIGGGFVSFIIYFLILPQGEWFNLLSIILIIINIICFVYSVIFGFKIEMSR